MEIAIAEFITISFSINRHLCTDSKTNYDYVLYMVIHFIDFFMNLFFRCKMAIKMELYDAWVQKVFPGNWIFR
jgi:hypothetical protein